MNFTYVRKSTHDRFRIKWLIKVQADGTVWVDGMAKCTILVSNSEYKVLNDK